LRVLIKINFLFCLPSVLPTPILYARHLLLLCDRSMEKTKFSEKFNVLCFLLYRRKMPFFHVYYLPKKSLLQVKIWYSCWRFHLHVPFKTHTILEFICSFIFIALHWTFILRKYDSARGWSACQLSLNDWIVAQNIGQLPSLHKKSKFSKWISFWGQLKPERLWKDICQITGTLNLYIYCELNPSFYFCLVFPRSSFLTILV
jgi:hypothetical protein